MRLVAVKSFRLLLILFLTVAQLALGLNRMTEIIYFVGLGNDKEMATQLNYRSRNLIPLFPVCLQKCHRE